MNNENINSIAINNILIEIYKWIINNKLFGKHKRYVSPDSIPAVMLQCCRHSVWVSAAAFLLSLQFPPVLPALHTRMSYRSASRASISSHEKFLSASLNALYFKIITRWSILGSFWIERWRIEHSKRTLWPWQTTHGHCDSLSCWRSQQYIFSPEAALWPGCCRQLQGRKWHGRCAPPAVRRPPEPGHRHTGPPDWRGEAG